MLYERLMKGEAESREDFNVDFTRKFEADQELAHELSREKDMQEDSLVQAPAFAPLSIESAGGRSHEQVPPSLQPHPKAVSSSVEEDPLQILAEEELRYTHAKAQHRQDEPQDQRRANIKSNFVRTYLAQARASLQ